jgi:hypothetical protein
MYARPLPGNDAATMLSWQDPLRSASGISDAQQVAGNLRYTSDTRDYCMQRRPQDGLSCVCIVLLMMHGRVQQAVLRYMMFSTLLNIRLWPCIRCSVQVHGSCVARSRLTAVCAYTSDEQLGSSSQGGPGYTRGRAGSLVLEDVEHDLQATGPVGWKHSHAR